MPPQPPVTTAILSTKSISASPPQSKDQGSLTAHRVLGTAIIREKPAFPETAVRPVSSSGGGTLATGEGGTMRAWWLVPLPAGLLLASPLPPSILTYDLASLGGG